MLEFNQNDEQGVSIMRSALGAAVLATALAAALPVQAADPESCEDVTFSDVGWTDITATTGNGEVFPCVALAFQNFL